MLRILRFRSFLKDLRNRVLGWCGAYFWAERWLKRHNAIVAINVHRLLSEEAFGLSNSPRGMVMKEKTFREMCEYIRRTFRFADPSELHHTTQEQYPAILLTLDDGWIDNVEPLAALAEHEVSPLVFLCTGKMGSGNPFWPELAGAIWRKARVDGSNPGTAVRPDTRELLCIPHDDFIQRLKEMGGDERKSLLADLSDTFSPKLVEIDSTMSWEDAKRLQHLGVVFGSHGRTHELLPSLGALAIHEEVAISRDEVIDHLGSCDHFAYPNGDWNDRACNEVELAGYKKAFINSPGPITSGTATFANPRANLSESKVTDRSGIFSRHAFLRATVWASYRSRPKHGGVTVPRLDKRTRACGGLPQS